VSAAAATNTHDKAANTNSSPLLKEVIISYPNGGAIPANNIIKEQLQVAPNSWGLNDESQ
jgi:hypothetical protein